MGQAFFNWTCLKTLKFRKKGLFIGNKKVFLKTKLTKFKTLYKNVKIKNSIYKVINYHRCYNCDNVTAIWSTHLFISSSGFSS